VVVGVAFTWRALQLTFFGSSGALAQPNLLPITWSERLGAMLLAAATLAVGLYPRLLLDLIAPSLQSPLFEALRRGVGR
jgi:NADH-quinone oxidoreductase subunit M